MHPTQSPTLPCAENRPADDSPAGVVIPFPGTYAGAASQPETGGQPTEDGTPAPAAAIEQVFAQIADREQRIRALTARWHAIKQAREQTAERGQRTRALTERWNAMEQAGEQTAEREQRIRALTERWHAIKQAREQAAEREQRTRAITERWHVIMQAQGRTTKRMQRARARVAAFVAMILRAIGHRADAASVEMGSQCADRP